MKVLITGSEGYIGTVLVPMLMERGYEVVGLDACFLSYRYFVPGIRSYPLIIKDVRDVVPDDLKGFDAVIHLAALSNDPLGEINPDITEAVNYRASVKIAKIARDVGVQRFLFASSCSIYGSGQSEKLDENSSFNPLTAYAVSKVKAEEDISKLANDDFSPVFLRNGTAYGLSPRMRFDIVLNNLTGWGYTTGKVTLLSDGLAWRPLVHIRDINQALIAALMAPSKYVHNQAFNVGMKNGNYKIRTIAKEVAKVVPESNVTYASGVEADKRNYNVSFDKIHTVLADYFKPTWEIKDGVEEIFHACRITNLTFDIFNGSEYITIKGLKKLIAEKKIDNDIRWKE